MGDLSHWALDLLARMSSYGLMVLGACLAIGALEFASPVRRPPWRHLGFNWTYGALNLVAVFALLPLTTLGAAYLVRHAAVGLIDMSALGFGGLGGDAVVVLVSALLGDFFGYWMHRLQHASPFVWQQHLLHHSDEYVNVTTTSRQHLLEDTVMDPFFVAVPMAILFRLPPVTVAWLSLVPSFWTYVVHANLRLGFGPLWWLISSPQYHRIHHSLEPQHMDRNFVSWFPVWDIVFGTAYRPRRGEFPDTGVAGVQVRSIPQAYALPLKGWWRMGLARLRRVPS